MRVKRELWLSKLDKAVDHKTYGEVILRGIQTRTNASRNSRLYIETKENFLWVYPEDMHPPEPETGIYKLNGQKKFLNREDFINKCLDALGENARDTAMNLEMGKSLLYNCLKKYSVRFDELKYMEKQKLKQKI